MAKDAPKKKVRMGRPPAQKPKDVQFRVRVDQTMADATEEYRERHLLGDRSDAVRHMMGRMLREEGLLPEPEGK